MACELLFMIVCKTLSSSKASEGICDRSTKGNALDNTQWRQVDKERKWPAPRACDGAGPWQLETMTSIHPQTYDWHGVEQQGGVNSLLVKYLLNYIFYDLFGL